MSSRDDGQSKSWLLTQCNRFNNSVFISAPTLFDSLLVSLEHEKIQICMVPMFPWCFVHESQLCWNVCLLCETTKSYRRWKLCSIRLVRSHQSMKSSILWLGSRCWVPRSQIFLQFLVSPLPEKRKTVVFIFRLNQFITLIQTLYMDLPVLI